MARKLKIPSQAARHKARLLREHDSRLRSDNLYALEREPLSFAMLTRDRDVAVLRTVSELLLKGCTFAQVQDAVLERHALDLSMDQVRKYRDTCHLLWQNELVSNFHAIVSKELARIAYEQSELWAEWERSKAGSRKHRKEHTESKGEAKSVTYSTESEVAESNPCHMKDDEFTMLVQVLRVLFVQRFRRVFSREGAAKYLNMSLRSFCRRVSDGSLPAGERTGHLNLTWYQDDLDSYARSQRTKRSGKGDEPVNKD